MRNGIIIHINRKIDEGKEMLDKNVDNKRTK